MAPGPYYVHELDDGQHIWTEVRGGPLATEALVSAGWQLRFLAVFDSARKASQFARLLGRGRVTPSRD